jgi:lysine 2,3-aminomutase
MSNTRGTVAETDLGDRPPSCPIADPNDEPPSPGTAVLTARAPRQPGHPAHPPESDWRWQMRNRVRTVDELLRRFPALGCSEEICQAAQTFPISITPYYASLIEAADASDPIFRMAVPQLDELVNPAHLSDDPLAEDEDMPVPGLVHRYRDRALVIATTTCSVYCRHCTRKRTTGQKESTLTAEQLRQITAYLTAHPEIRDVIVSGGDPFTMATATIERVLRAIRAVESVDIIRVGTRTPVVLPQRITNELVTMLRRYHPLFINTHFNHPVELTPAAAAACQRLVDGGIPVGNQSVLLRGVNDDPRLLETLFRGLVRNRVRPYYLFQCDLVKGVEHFRTPISRGIEVMEYLRGRVSGLAIPTFVVDAPHGGGKIPVLPNYIVSMSPTHTVLRNFEGVLVSYPEPTTLGEPTQAPRHESAPGVWELASGEYHAIQPSRSLRHRRRDRRPPLTLAMAPPKTGK